MRPHRSFNRRSYAGLYMANRFLITMFPEYPFFVERATDQEIDPNGQHFPIYLHEYWHFLQNTTTLSGFKSFAFSQHLLPFLSKAAVVNANGTVAGDSALTEDDHRNFGALIEAHRSLEGEPGPVGTEENFDIDFRVLSIIRTNRATMLRGRSIPLPEVQVEVEILDGSNHLSQRDTFFLGSLAIEESIALAVEETVAEGLSSPIEPVPVFPYRILERLFEHQVGTAEPALARVALGTLALMSTHPGPALHRKSVAMIGLS